MGQGVSGHNLGTRNRESDSGQQDLFGSDTSTEELNKMYQIKLPTNSAQIKHIFREEEGHLPDTPANQKKILDVANNENNYVGTSSNNNCTWYSEKQEDGSQIWVKVHGGTISNAGKNEKPRKWNSETGFDRNPNKGGK